MKFVQYLLFLFIFIPKTKACSIVYFVDEETGTIYVANNEDYWLNTKAYLHTYPKTKKGMARVWYGWKKFAQGGINEAGLFFDGAVTPSQKIPKGYSNPNGRNVGDELLAKCSTTKEAIDYLEKHKIALSDAHLMLGDAHGNAVVLEWINGIKKMTTITNNVLIATNFLLNSPNSGNFPCYRYNSIQERINNLKNTNKPITFNSFGNTIANTVQVSFKDATTNKLGGTLYSSFINIIDMKLFIVSKLDPTKLIKIDLKTTFLEKKKKKIKLY